MSSDHPGFAAPASVERRARRVRRHVESLLHLDREGDVVVEDADQSMVLFSRLVSKRYIDDYGYFDSCESLLHDSSSNDSSSNTTASCGDHTDSSDSAKSSADNGLRTNIEA